MKELITMEDSVDAQCFTVNACPFELNSIDVDGIEGDIEPTPYICLTRMSDMCISVCACIPHSQPCALVSCGNIKHKRRILQPNELNCSFAPDFHPMYTLFVGACNLRHWNSFNTYVFLYRVKNRNVPIIISMQN